jgi:hypothetical protein
LDEDEELSEEEVKKSMPSTRVSKIDLSPEAVHKRKEVYNKWLASVA